MIRIVNQKHVLRLADPTQSCWDMSMKLCRICVRGSSDASVCAATNLAASDMIEGPAGPK